MKKKPLSKNITVVFFLVSLIALLAGCKKDDIIEIGKEHAGGIVFYIDGSKQHGLVCASRDQSSNALWFNGTYVQTIATSTSVGSGQANTSTVIAALGNGAYAATICDNLTLNNYSDWFLPSSEELMLMCKNLSEVGIGSFSNSYYFSSTQPVNVGAYCLQFTNSPPSGYNISNCGVSFSAHVRAVRAF